MARCLSPIRMKGSNGYFVDVPCGKCPSCINNNWQQWIFRHLQELKYSKLGITITLTYEESNLPINSEGVPSVCKRDIQLFMKKLRSYFPPKSVRFFIVSEYGKNFYRPHYHGLLYFSHQVEQNRDEIENIISKSWQHGFIKFDGITEKSVAYTTKYLLKDSPQPVNGEKTFTLMSRRPGIGYKFIEDNKDYFGMNYSKMFITSTGGAKYSLPRYYKDKLFVNFDTSATSLLTYLGEKRKFFDSQLKKEIEKEKKLYLSLGEEYAMKFLSNLKQFKIERFERQKQEHHKKETF